MLKGTQACGDDAAPQQIKAGAFVIMEKVVEASPSTWKRRRRQQHRRRSNYNGDPDGIHAIWPQARGVKYGGRATVDAPRNKSVDTVGIGGAEVASGATEVHWKGDGDKGGAHTVTTVNSLDEMRTWVAELETKQDCARAETLGACVICRYGPVEEEEEAYWACDRDRDPVGAGNVGTPAGEMPDAPWPHEATDNREDVADVDHERHTRGAGKTHWKFDGDTPDEDPATVPKQKQLCRRRR
jgi:hypothetical protein